MAGAVSDMEIDERPKESESESDSDSFVSTSEVQSETENIAGDAVATESTPQTEPLSDNQVPNSAGGYSYKVSDMNRLRRFLILGSEGGTYHINERKLGLENAICITKLIKDGKGEEVLNEIESISVEGRAAKQNPLIFAYALCARQTDDEKLKKATYEKINKILRIPTHLFQFVEYCQQLSPGGTGWGRAHRRGVSNWYLHYSKTPKHLAQHVTKYRKREGWTHKDVLRLAHPKPQDPGVKAVLKYVVKGLEDSKSMFFDEKADKEIKDVLKEVYQYLKAVEDVKVMSDANEVAKVIEAEKLSREHIPTQLLNDICIWRHLLSSMGMTAMIRNLGKMSKVGLLAENSPAAQQVCADLHSKEKLKAAKIHPFNILLALHTYRAGKGEKGSLEWPVNIAITGALEKAFYKSFKNVEPTNKRYCLAMDVSGSMSWGGVNGCSSITPREASAALSMVTLRSEEHCEIIGFSHCLQHLAINKTHTLQNVIDVITKTPMGGTDCAQPMLWARKEKKKFDVFIIYTDCETWAGAVHPSVALQEYRQAMEIPDAKLIVCAMTSNGFTLADPEDAGMLDMAGFDSNGPEIMRSFSLGQL